MSDTLLYRVAGVDGKSERGCQMADSVLLWGPQPGAVSYTHLCQFDKSVPRHGRFYQPSLVPGIENR